jgi:hypothetical protein
VAIQQKRNAEDVKKHTTAPKNIKDTYILPTPTKADITRHGQNTKVSAKSTKCKTPQIPVPHLD